MWTAHAVRPRRALLAAVHPFGPRGASSAQTDPLDDVGWKFVFASSDDTQRATMWADVAGVSDHDESQSGGPAPGF